MFVCFSVQQHFRLDFFFLLLPFCVRSCMFDLLDRPTLDKMQHRDFLLAEIQSMLTANAHLIYTFSVFCTFSEVMRSIENYLLYGASNFSTVNTASSALIQKCAKGILTVAQHQHVAGGFYRECR